MKWQKLGLLFAPPRNLPWLASHAAIPVAFPIGREYRVYYSGRDDQGRARIGFFEFNPDELDRGLIVDPNPAIDLGPLGTFDDRGVTSSWVLRDGESVLHYYSGWSLGVTVPFYFYVGLARSNDDGKTFRSVSPAPVLERSNVDPYLTASPCVLREGDLWRMWYVSGTRWESRPNETRHYYHIKYAESNDGIRWDRRGHVCIDYRDREEYAIARPCVLKTARGYRMWYSYRGERYRIGYAESADGLCWQRKDNEVGIDVSPEGWDSEMVCYAYVFAHRERLYMLYNGNGYGQTGIGLAQSVGD